VVSRCLIDHFSNLNIDHRVLSWGLDGSTSIVEGMLAICKGLDVNPSNSSKRGKWGESGQYLHCAGTERKTSTTESSICKLEIRDEKLNARKL
jgi:hypothetical protein